MAPGRRNRRSDARRRSPTRTFAAVGLVLTAAVVLPLGIWLRAHWLLAWMAGVNVAVFLLYGWDKIAARRSWLRVPERLLHAWAFAGGTPAAFLAQRTFRHKTVKGQFRFAFWTLAVLQLALVVWATWYFELWRRPATG